MKQLLHFTHILVTVILTFAAETSQAQQFFKVEKIGKGKPVIFIHGLSCSGEVWKETVEKYKANYECHVITVAGFGGVAPHLTDHFLEAVKNDIISYVRDKKLDKPVLVGHSMGGYLSLWAASDAPGVFSKVISVDGLPFFPAMQNPNATGESTKAMAASIKAGMADQTPEQVIASEKTYLPSMIRDTARISQVAKIAAKSDTKTQAEVMYEMYTTDLRKTVSSINCPVLVLGAWIAYQKYGATKEYTTALYKGQLANIKNCQFEMADNAMHFIFFDDKEWFFSKVDAFLK